MKKHTLVILGGNSSENENWIQKIDKYLEPEYSTAEFSYSHWGKNPQEIDFEKELERLSKYIRNKRIRNYSIVAKSAGFVLALQGVAANVLNPRTIVGFGLPIEYANYRKIDLRALIESSARSTSIVCIQADEDPQGSLGRVEELIADVFPVLGIEGRTHDYDRFEQMVNIAKSFVAMHQPQIEQKTERIDNESLLEAIRSVSQFPENFSFKNNWLFDIERKIYIFKFKNKKIVLKRGSLHKINKEIENASKLEGLIGKIKIGKKKLIVVVPDVYKISSEEGYLVSEYVGPDCNELFYQNIKEVLSTQEVISIVEKLNELSILHKNLLPRNTIVKNNRIYLIDLEDVLFGKDLVRGNLHLKTSVLVGWRNVNQMSRNDIESVFPSRAEIQLDPESLNEYENTFKSMLGLVSVDNYQIRKLCYENIITATSYVNEHLLIKIDDVLHSLSGILPIEVELLVDFLLREEYESKSNSLYRKLSNIIKVTRIRSSIDVHKSEVQSFLYEEIKKIILRKLTNEYADMEVKKALVLIIQNKYPEFKPSNSYLLSVQKYLSTQL